MTKIKILMTLFIPILILAAVLTACGTDSGSGHTHEYGGFTMVEAPKCITPGRSVRVCAGCGDEESREIPPLFEHSFGGDGICISCGAKRATEDLTYTLSGDGTYYILIAVPAAAQSVTVDCLYERKRVLEIGAGAFKNPAVSAGAPLNNTALKSVTLNPGITKINGGAFMYCTALASVDLPESLITIGANAFSGCTALRGMELNEGLKELGAGAFQHCNNLAEITFPSSLETIGGSAFQGCTQLALAALPQSLTSLGSSAFYGCTALASVDFGSADRIRAYTFFGCVNLKEISLPDSVSAIDSSAFENCTALSAVCLPSGINPASIAQTAFKNTAYSAG